MVHCALVVKPSRWNALLDLSPSDESDEWRIIDRWVNQMQWKKQIHDDGWDEIGYLSQVTPVRSAHKRGGVLALRI